MEFQKHRRISVGTELGVLIRDAFHALVSDRLSFYVSLGFPLLADLVLIWIAGENMYVNMESTNSACFTLVCAAMWVGLFNSVSVIVKEREYIKRHVQAGAFRFGCYTASRAMIQFLLCAFQSVVLCLFFLGVHVVYGTELPEQGLIFHHAIVEYWISILLLVLSANSLGLCLSCLVKTPQGANQLTPYILILEILFSGMLFSLKGGAKYLSALMINRWGMEALGSTSDLNGLPLRLQEQFSMIPHAADDAYLYTAGHLGKVWLILLVFVFLPLFLGNILLHRVTSDSRS